jgi:hypothetical protein
MDNFGNKDKKHQILVRKHTNISRNNTNMGLSLRYAINLKQDTFIGRSE